MDEPIITQQRESVKLLKMSKGFNWEIKVMGDPFMDDEAMKKLHDLNTELEGRYGNQE